MVQTQFASRKKVGQSRNQITADGQIGAIEKEIRETPYHKGTQRHIGILRAKLARLKDQSIEASTKSSGGGGGYAVKKQGDATAVLVGLPSVGKSTLLNKLTNAKSKVAPYSFTTVSVIPGMMKYKNAMIQVLDVPGLIKGAEEGKGRGREVLSVVRGANLMIIMTDPANIDAFESISKALERNGIRVNKTPPEATIDKKPGGGIIIHSNIKQEVDQETIKELAMQFGIRNAEIILNERLSWDRLIDAFAKNRVYIPAIFVVNKADLLLENSTINTSMYRYLQISAKKEEGLEELRQEIWNKLNFVQVYLVKEENPDRENPMVVKKGVTLQAVAEKIGADFATDKTSAKIWGSGAKYPGQEVSLSTVVRDGMQIKFL